MKALERGLLEAKIIIVFLLVIAVASIGFNIWMYDQYFDSQDRCPQGYTEQSPADSAKPREPQVLSACEKISKYNCYEISHSGRGYTWFVWNNESKKLHQAYFEDRDNLETFLKIGYEFENGTQIPRCDEVGQ